MSGQEPQKRTTKARKPRAGARIEELETELKPRILVPTPAQLAAGQRVIDADPAIWPDAVALMVRKAKAHGWNVRVTYSHYMDVPPFQGKYVGQWVEKFMLAVRLSKPGIQAWGTWIGIADEGWSADCAQAQSIFAGRTRGMGVTDLEKLVTGKVYITRGTAGCALLEAVNERQSGTDVLASPAPAPLHTL